jgi:hypothetical protein
MLYTGYSKDKGYNLMKTFIINLAIACSVVFIADRIKKKFF